MPLPFRLRRDQLLRACSQHTIPYVGGRYLNARKNPLHPEDLLGFPSALDSRHPMHGMLKVLQSKYDPGALAAGVRLGARLMKHHLDHLAAKAPYARVIR